ncbi:pyruvate kinase [Anaerobium acetethylicum]|uniref:Pyruvate kinase n=1 Tax=Anaerobium acetethylicum TaxID=1619234 RepID=A0A1D3TRL9_9FIRM|nr:pyruvate kinase [Anaerobium acetethylicum]SCP96393.1 pyruvate kinase [Anaerobium acetethylicum]
MRKTKIICTLGPSVRDDATLRELMLSGMNIARINFSHGTYAEHKKALDQVTKLREELNLPIATLLDTKGPEVRIKSFKEGKVELKKGQTFILTTREIEGDSSIVSLTYPNLVNDVHVGSTILIDDGLIEMTVTGIKDSDIICEVQNNGFISNNKGVNVPGVNLSMPFISPKDREDIIWGIQHDFDFVAASFTRSADDILEIRKIFSEYNCNTVNIIAKIENLQGVDNIDEIIRVSDGIMIARGDMGVEIPLEDVPVIQKMIIKKVYNAGKQVITATQMLDSMMKNPRPTRAEATDVANAIYDGTSAIMLSGETAAGQYPVEALKTMVKIAKRAESDINLAARFKLRESLDNPDVTNAISHATCTTAHDLNASAIVTLTHSGKTARMVSKYRPICPIIGCSPNAKVCRQLNLSWGVTPLLINEESNSDELFDHAIDAAEKAGLVKAGEITVITAGVPLGISGTTNIIKVQVVGHVLLKGIGVTEPTVCARLCVCKTAEEAKEAFLPGDILVIPETSNELMSQLKHASGIITEADGTNSHAAVVGLSLDIPVIIGAVNATKILKSGAFVTMDPNRGIVFCNTNKEPAKKDK